MQCNVEYVDCLRKGNASRCINKRAPPWVSPLREALIGGGRGARPPTPRMPLL